MLQFNGRLNDWLLAFVAFCGAIKCTFIIRIMYSLHSGTLNAIYDANVAKPFLYDFSSERIRNDRNGSIEVGVSMTAFCMQCIASPKYSSYERMFRSDKVRFYRTEYCGGLDNRKWEEKKY